jgi:hypothetical protein
MEAMVSTDILLSSFVPNYLSAARIQEIMPGRKFMVN